MQRRRFVKALTVLPAAPAVLAQQTGSGQAKAPIADELPRLDQFSVPDAAAEPVPHFFSSPQLSALRRLSDVILPKIGETPGAHEARAAEFLDFLISQSPDDRKELYRGGLDALNAASAAKFGKPFADLNAAQADEVLSPLRERWTYAEPATTLAAFLRAAKADVLMATSNSREWIAVVSKRNRGASGTALYWHPIA